MNRLENLEILHKCDDSQVLRLQLDGDYWVDGRDLSNRLPGTTVKFCRLCGAMLPAPKQLANGVNELLNPPGVAK